MLSCTAFPILTKYQSWSFLGEAQQEPKRLADLLKDGVHKDIVR